MTPRNTDQVPAPDSAAIEQAWKIHAAQADWTARVDAKATFAFTIESASIATAVALSAQGRLFSVILSGIEAVLYWTGLLTLLVGASFAILVVIPRLRAATVKTTHPHNYIYFGHVKHWNSDNLAQALQARDILPVITRQIVVMADIAWQKHRWVQISMSLGAAGGGLLVLCGLLLAVR